MVLIWLSEHLGLVMRYIFLMMCCGMLSWPAMANSLNCAPAIRVVVDLGYCYGFVEAYYDAAGYDQILNQMEEGNVEGRIREAHDQCYPTSFDQQKVLGQLAFASYLNLEDSALLNQSANDCSMLMKDYADQLLPADNASQEN